MGPDPLGSLARADASAEWHWSVRVDSTNNRAHQHRAVSTWLNAGVPETQVAERAGHSVNVLLRVYAKCVYGQEDLAPQRIEGALSRDA